MDGTKENTTTKMSLLQRGRVAVAAADGSLAGVAIVVVLTLEG